jgi:class 3 adenylate cyclase
MSANSVASVTGWLSIGSLDRTRLFSRAAFITVNLVFLVLLVFSVANALRWLDRPFPGFLVNARMVVADYGQSNWPGEQAGLGFPAKLMSVNGKTIARDADLEQVLRDAGIGTDATYVFDLNGQPFQLSFPIAPFTTEDLLATFGVEFLAALLYIVLGVVVFVMKPDTELSWVFFLACFWLAIYVITGFDTVSTHKSLLAYHLAGIFLPASFAHMSLVFPYRWEFTKRHPAVVSIPYMVSAAIFVPFHAYYPGPVFLALYPFVYAYFFLGAISPAASGIVAYFKGNSIIAKQRAKVILFGAAVAFPLPALMYVVPLLGGSWGTIRFNANFLVLAILVYPACIAYAISKHNLFDVDVYIKRAVGYVIMTGVVGLGYFSFQAIASAVIFRPLFGEYAQDVYPLAFALLIVFFFNPINRKIQDSVDRLLFPRKNDKKENIIAESNALSSVLNLDDIIMQIVKTLRKGMFLDTAGLVILETEKKSCQSFFISDGPNDGEDNLKDVSVSFDDPLIGLLSREKNLVTKYDLEEDPRYLDVKETCRERFSEMSASLAIPLLYKGEVMGLLALGDKKSGHFYTRDDIDLLHTMADEGAVAIMNAITHQEVVRYAEELAGSLKRIQILESIKSNLSKFVPKTVQDLIDEAPEAPSFDKHEANLSVLFADISGYTRISAQLEFSEVNRLVEGYFSAFLDEILAQGGDVNETAGDGLMVIFQHEDPQRHARAAVLAALGIQRRAQEMNVQLHGQYEPVGIRVGVNSGLASVGVTKIEGVAGTRWTYTASGTTTNVAARLSALAEGGVVIIGEETRRRIGDDFKVEDLGPQSLKNVPEPTRAYRLTAEA